LNKKNQTLFNPILM